MSAEVPIPAPRGVPIIGNLLEIEADVPLNSFERLAETYGTACAPQMESPLI